MPISNQEQETYVDVLKMYNNHNGGFYLAESSS